MYLLILATVVAIAVGIGTWLLGAGWLGGIFFGLIALVASWIFGARRLARRIEPAFEQVQRQLAAGNVKHALAGLERLLPLARWMPLLGGQIRGQMGMLHYQSGDRDAAIACLAQAGRHSGDAKLLLAALRYQAGDKDAAFAEIQRALPFNRKHALLHNLYAWLLNKEGRREEAMAVMARYLVKNGDQPSKDNHLRLQNEQRMNMQAFGMMWFALGFERPPASMGQMRTARKGFRQPPKRTGS